MIIYLAEPMDFADASPMALGLTRGIQRVMPEVHIFRPKTGWFGARAPDHRLQTINRSTISSCDAVVAVLPDRARTYGVPMEMEFARGQGIPVALLAPWNTEEAAALVEYDHVRDTDEALDWLANVDIRTEATLRVSGHEPNVGMLPKRAYQDDAGYDLSAAQDVEILSHCSVKIPVGVRAEMPPGYWGLVVARSSAILDGLWIHGVVDPGYRGPLDMTAVNLSDMTITVRAGQRVGQLVLVPNAPAFRVQVVSELSPSARGSNGYGSSGK